jgi:hypothetical protein
MAMKRVIAALFIGFSIAGAVAGERMSYAKPSI